MFAALDQDASGDVTLKDPITPIDPPHNLDSACR